VIHIPKRSVTRFFIPLIDVLTLLFCIYLLLPIVKSPADANGADPLSESRSRPLDQQERQELAKLRLEVKSLRKPGELADSERQALESLRQEKIGTLQQRLAVRVLEIDAETGKLFQYDPERVEIRNESDARSSIERHKREAGGRELYYLFLFPRKITGFPEERQMKQYERWFTGVAHGIDNPRRGG
jgi:hypothetical protein